jgi:bacterioferritin-associated ferredoxin
MCNDISEKDIKKSIAAGCKDFDEAFKDRGSLLLQCRACEEGARKQFQQLVMEASGDGTLLQRK